MYGNMPVQPRLRVKIFFEIQIRKHRLISISKELVLKNEVGRAYYHT